MDKRTQCDRILDYLRKHKTATRHELRTKLNIAEPHARLYEMTNEAGFIWCTRGRLGDPGVTGDRITRSFITSPGGARIVQYRLVLEGEAS